MKEQVVNNLNIISEVLKHQDGKNLDTMDLLSADKNIKKYCASIAKKRLVINNDTHKINGILPEEINSELID